MSKEAIVNEQIKPNVIILIDSAGTNRKQFSKVSALKMAKDEGLDLIQVSEGETPVCKIADYGKMKYDRNKVERKQNHAPTSKEIYFGNDIAEHDLTVKIKKICELLEKKHRVSVFVEFKGRQKSGDQHREHGRNLLKKVVSQCSGVTSSVSSFGESPSNIIATLSPK